MIKLSIVVPTYNRASMIDLTLNSLIKIKGGSIEIIIVDDGSTDDTEDVVRKYLCENIKYFKKSNEERAVARNFGLQKSSGDYINFFDSDDLAYANHFEEALATITKYNSPEVFHLNYDYRDENYELLPNNTNHIGDINKSLLSGNILSCNGVFIRRDIALKNQFNTDRNLSASEDYLLWLQLAAQYKIYHNPEVTSSIVYHEKRSVLKVNLDSLVKRKELMIHYLFTNEITKDFYANFKNKMTSDAQSYMALHITLASNIPSKKAIPYLINSIRNYPRSLFKKRTWATVKRLILPSS